MTGPEHYTAGQQWLQTAEKAYREIGRRPYAEHEADSATRIATAHFHAAQVAATIAHAYDTHTGADSAFLPPPIGWDEAVDPEEGQ